MLKRRRTSFWPGPPRNADTTIPRSTTSRLRLIQPQAMKCDSCGKEADFERGFIKERKSFRSSYRTLCPTCWSRRRFALEGWLQIMVLAEGILGYVLLWLDSQSVYGQILTAAF